MPDTPRYDPDTVRHPQTPSRHPPGIGVFNYLRALEEKAISELARLLYILPTDLVLIYPQTHSDSIQTPSDTIQTPPDIGIFMQYRAPE